MNPSSQAPATALAHDTAQGPHDPWRPMLRRGLLVQLLCLLIAGLLWAARHNGSSFFHEWVYSEAIGTSCWLIIDLGRYGLARYIWSRTGRPESAGGWPGAHWMITCMVLGTLAGLAIGTRIGDSITGHHVANPLNSMPALVVSFVATLVATTYFYATERMQHERAAAESARRLAVENQLRLLESQLEPHMLFNTLANLRVLIGVDPPRAQAMLDRLIAFLRSTLEASRQRMHPLATEFERLSDYLALMAVRMGPRLRFTLDLPDDLRAEPVPPLLLQPLVENAIKHGLEPNVEGGLVAVRAWRDGERLRIEVRDTGVGIAAAAARADAGSRFGTQQVTERLQAVYGPAAHLHIEPAADGEAGTLARIELPWPAGADAAAQARPSPPSDCSPP